MTRTISSQMKSDLYASQTGEVYIQLITIDHADLVGDPIRLTDNTEQVTVTATGEVFLPYPFEILMPDDDDEKLPELQLRVDNIGLDRRIISELRTITSAPTVTYRIARATTPGAAVVEIEPLPFVWRGVEYDSMQIQGTLRMAEDFLDEGWPGLDFTPGAGFKAVTVS